MIRCAGNAIDRVIGGHYGICLPFHNGRPEPSEIVFVHGLLGDIGLALHPILLLVVYGKVFRRRDNLKVMRIVALESANERDSQPGGKVRILSISLSGAAPARVASHVEVG